MDPRLLLSCLSCVYCHLLARAPNLPSTTSNLRAKTSNFDRFAVLWFRVSNLLSCGFRVSNLLAMAPQPAFDGLQPKSEDLQR